MRFFCRPGSKIDRRDAGPTHRWRATARPRLQGLEDRALPSFGFGSAFSVGGTGSDTGLAIALDGAGSRYVAGIFSNTVDFDPNDVNHTNAAATLTATGTNNDGNAFAAKYASDGTFQWVVDLGAGTASTSDQIAVQGSHLYVTYNGFPSAGTEFGYFSALDTGTGAVQWTTNFGANSQTLAVAISPTGMLYADGFSNTSSSAPSHAIVDRLDPASGNILWTRASTGGLALAQRLAVDGAGNVYATGIYDSYSTATYYGLPTFGSTTLTDPYGNDAAFVWKLNASGGSVWAGGMGSSGGTGAYAGTGIYSTRGIAADGSGNVYVTGEWVGGSNNFNPGSGRAVSLTNKGDLDAFIVKLTPGKNGAMSLGWAADIGGSGNDCVNALAVDSSGNVYTTGLFNGTVNFNPNTGTAHNLSGGGIFVSKLDSNGNYVAAVGLGGTADGSGLGAGDGIALDGSGNVYVTGSFDDTVNFNPTGTNDLTSNGAADVFVLKLTQTNSPGAMALPSGLPPITNTGAVNLSQTESTLAPPATVDSTAPNLLDWFAAAAARKRSMLFADWLADGDAA